MPCPSCGRENPPEARFCNGCGSQLAAACPACSQPNPPGSGFCSACGQRLREPVRVCGAISIQGGANPAYAEAVAGEVIKEGEDFFGRNVIMAARVAAQAQGGEILASGVLKALVEGSDVSWGELRTVQLKGLSGEHEIWPVNWEVRPIQG